MEILEAEEPTSVYIARAQDGSVLYVGITGVRIKRVGQHRQSSEWWRLAVSLELEHFPTRKAALARELELIKDLQPPHNRTIGQWWDARDLLIIELRQQGVPQSQIMEQLDMSAPALKKAVRRLIGDGRIERLPAGRKPTT